MGYVEKLETAIYLAMELYPLDILKRQKYIDNFMEREGL